MNKIPSSGDRPRRRRADLSDVLFRLGGTLMCVVFSGVVGQTIVSYEDRQDLIWYVWLALALVATSLAAIGTVGTIISFWRGW